jgi:hypothetical protein
VKLRDSTSLEIEEICRSSKSGIRPGYFMIELFVEDQKSKSKALISLLVIDVTEIKPKENQTLQVNSTIDFSMNTTESSYEKF